MPDANPTRDERPIAPTDQDRARAKEALGNVCVHDDDTMGQYKTQGWHSPASEDSDEIEDLAKEFAAVRAEALAARVDREDLVESVARALHAAIDEGLDWDLLPDRVKGNYRNHARAVLTALATALGRVPAKPSTRLPTSPFDLYALIRLEDAISNIDHPGADSEEWTHKAKVAARELERAARADERAPFQKILATPAPGWFTFGTHIDQPDLELEFWGAETSPDGLPTWERPRTALHALTQDDLARAIYAENPVEQPWDGEAYWYEEVLDSDKVSLANKQAEAVLTVRSETTDAAKIEAAARAIDPDPWTMSAAEFEAEYGGAPDWSEQSQAGRIEGSKTLAEQALEAAGAIGRG